MHIAILECSAISKCMLITKWQVVCNGEACATEPGPITTKRKLLKTFLYISHTYQPFSLLFGSTLSKIMPNDVCILGKSKYAIICK